MRKDHFYSNGGLPNCQAQPSPYPSWAELVLNLINPTTPPKHPETTQLVTNSNKCEHISEHIC